MCYQQKTGKISPKPLNILEIYRNIMNEFQQRIKKFCILTGKMMDPKKLVAGAQPKHNKRFYRTLKKLYNCIPKGKFRNQYNLTLEGTVQGDKK